MAIYDTELPIRPDLAAAHAEVLDRFATAGTHWSSAERLAMVTEVRRARDAAELAPWEAPSTVDGLIDADHALPAPAVDAIWRLTNHPGTLTADWYQSIIDRGLVPEKYVELVGVVAQANSIDRFADALALDRPQLPGPDDSEPSGERPRDLAVRTHWVPTADRKGPNVSKSLSAVPNEDESRAILLSAQYVKDGDLLGDLTSDQYSLTRLQVELVAARTSKLNECFY